ncbi:inosine/uridine-preferring nucleoside hydrolase domain-containing protein [Artemisia annua]|uniref:Inosine/uridine-preferring nucleoside hydrolase domain-containing protein n=1 Tax=Artemisia annua TaxID=35608 RepID=A0A2U1NZD4_ARTAN|nr:inosine/uridine-preferring nucleoside hydrolase domain-containing protein [Artemisia annua]
MKRSLLLSNSLCALIIAITGIASSTIQGDTPHRILLDTDVDTDDIFAILYLLKLNRSEFDFQAITINTNSWSNAGHGVNQIYDILYMMGRDDIDVGVGGDGGILENGTILPNVGGYLPIIDQGNGTAGPCRYRQAIPVGSRLKIDTNNGLRRSFLPQGSRRYSPIRQATTQQVMIKTISKGPTSVLITGSLTNLAIFLMSNSHLKSNIDHIYIMGGGVRSKSSSCQPQQCCDCGNIFTAFRSNPYAEFNFFCDPFAAYQVIHSGIPITLVPLDATNTIPITYEFFETFKNNQQTYEAQYAFKSLKMVHDTWHDNQFYKSFFLWDSFMAMVAISSMRNIHQQLDENEFAELEYMNITVVTSNKPYGISDGSNPCFDGRDVPKFNLDKNGVHSGHIQTGIQDLFCLRENEEGLCKDGSIEEVTGPDSVRVIVATRAKPNRGNTSSLDNESFVSFINVLNQPQYRGRFNFTSEYPYYKEVLYQPDFKEKKLGKIVVFDMDMSTGDFLALFYLLKVPVEVIDLKAILITGTGWANAATIDVVYDLLHMMGRDDIIVGLGDSFGLNQSYPKSANIGDCKYSGAIPHGSSGRLDTDTLYGLTRDLPRSPRRFTAENSVEFGAPRTTDSPELRQPLALEVWRSLVKSIDDGSNITILTNGPLTNLANILLSDTNSSSIIQEVYILGGHIDYERNKEKGNANNVPLNDYAELNMFLDSLAAKTVFDSSLTITLIPLSMQRKVYAFPEIIQRLQQKNMTAEAIFTRRLLIRLNRLQQNHLIYQHMNMFLGEILGAIIFGSDQKYLNSTFEIKYLKIQAKGDLSSDGQVIDDTAKMKGVSVLKDFNHESVYDVFATHLLRRTQSAVIGSFDEQKRLWSSSQQNKMGGIISVR